ncbi:hypothetical protein ACEWY4_016485 [Coilia grayii]|uniref:NAD(P)(+)--arginine ADP-ribosyltransferase n=1 Tax=Coilia grayii TaxID=363190 RepID=A0ABD1JKP6_9TELE
MAPLSVDDDYHHCSSNMTKLLLPKYLQKEKFGDFGHAWEHAEHHYMDKIRWMNPKQDNLTTEHGIAIHIYTDKTSKIYASLNHDVRKGRDSYNRGHFSYHSLHFLLTDAVQRLNKGCVHTYRGTDLTFAPPKGEIRFGAFTSTSKDKARALGFGTKTCFEITTCHGAPISKYSAFPNEQEVLIPPYEKFEVVSNPRTWPTQDCEVVYHLKSTGTKSNLRCALFGRGWQFRTYCLWLYLTFLYITFSFI